MFSRILLAVDDSDNSRRAIEVARTMAKGSDLGVVLFHAFHVPTEFSGLASQFATSDNYLDTIRAAIRSEADKLLAQYEKQLAADVVYVEKLLEEGKPGPAIIHALTTQKCELAMLGKRGRGRITELLLGSTSDYVVHNAEVPVIVVP